MQNSPRILSTADRHHIYNFGKLPPQNCEIEIAVLGACMVASDTFIRCREILHADAFYKDNHQVIYKVFDELFTENSPIDILTVSSRLRKNGTLDNIGGPFALTELTKGVAGGSHTEYHCRLILEAWYKRTAIEMASNIIKESYEDTSDALKIIDNAQTMLDVVYGSITGTKQESFIQQVEATVENIEKASKSDKHILGHPTGFRYRDIITSGRCGKTLSIIAGRPSSGKSSYMLQEVINLSDNGVPTLIFSLEMSAYELIIKMMSNYMRRDSNAIRNGKVPMDTVRDVGVMLKKKKVYLLDASKQNILQMRASAKTMKKKYGIQSIYVDYLQLADGTTTGKGTTREQEVGSVAVGLKMIAKDLDVPVIALAQLSRALELRGDKRPIMSDLRESGQIENAADVIEFLYRAEYHGVLNDPETHESTEGIIEGIIAKNRNGALGTYKARFNKQHSRIEEILDSDTARYYGLEVRDPSTGETLAMKEKTPF